jgi:hypothetical protein
VLDFISNKNEGGREDDDLRGSELVWNSMNNLPLHLMCFPYFSTSSG